MGRNARVAVVPYLGYTMDDAAAISESFARALTSEHIEEFQQSFDHDTRGGRDHFHALFPEVYKGSQLENIDEKGVVKPGTVLQPGDPVILATRPRTFTSKAQLGKLSRAMTHMRGDASQKWEGDVPAEVIDTATLRDGSVKVLTRSLHPARPGDKLSARSGQKGVIAKIIPDDKMPRGEDGEPFDMLMNPASFVSRVNDALLFEILAGKVAAKTGKPVKVPQFTDPGSTWLEKVAQMLEENGLKSEELVYDPDLDLTLENPVMTGVAYIQKLHHTADSKASGRGQSGYSLDEQPLKGGGEGAQAKRMSGLEMHALMSAGAYGTMHDAAAVRGQKNLEYWQAWKQGQTPRKPGRPFVWDKFRALLTGAGMNTRDMGGGTLRLGAMTDRDVEALKPEELRNGELVDMNRNMEPVEGGLVKQPACQF